MYRRNSTLLLLLAGLFLVSACSKDEKDLLKPEITFIYPIACDTLYAGQTFQLDALLEDDTELSEYSIQIHHNFDHHGHSTETIACEMDEDKEAVNPFKYSSKNTIPEGETVYEAKIKIEIPDSIDAGDYHLQVTLVDKAGWSNLGILSVKIQ